ncbi:MAG: helix-turn-helix domain-containing protein [Pseudonocardiaceae bacterium]|nr:helix-turn-helix domain-containing protein [Pseudonocardiaceae bacterium]
MWHYDIAVGSSGQHFHCLSGGTVPESFRPSVRLRRIARALREWRESTGLGSGEVAGKAGWSAAKQSRLENASQPITPADVMTLALLYDVPESARNDVFHAALHAQQQGWWDAVAKGALAADVLSYVELESEASSVRTFKIDLMPGLLQTAEYAEAISRANLPRTSEDILRRRVAARVQRQARLEGDNPINVEAVLAEGALRTQVGGPDVMRQQLEHLVELSSRRHVELCVVAARSGAYPAMGTPFSILSFDNGDPDIGYVELVSRGVYLEEPEEVEPYKLGFTGVQEVALDPRESVELISTIARDLER